VIKENFTSGFCTIIGPPNAGKSTLLNTFLNYHLNIISPQPQTTRNNIVGILNKDNTQIIFTDTPGILKTKRSLLDNHMESSISKSLESTDILLFLIDIKESIEPYKSFLEKAASLVKNQIIIVYNKIDSVKEPYEQYIETLPYAHTFISAKEKKNIETLQELIIPFCKDPIEYYPKDILSNRTNRFFVKEYIRESLLFHLQDEIPHECFVDVEEMKELSEKWEIKVIIYCNKESQKKIIIGNKGSMIKNIGIESRKKIETLLEKRVSLTLLVKTEKKWRDNINFLKKLEYY
jgi:GTP-binding protein Era